MANINAKQDDNQIFGIHALSGTLGTTYGTATTIPITATEDGQLRVYSGASSGTVVDIHGGTVNTIGTILGIGGTVAVTGGGGTVVDIHGGTLGVLTNPAIRMGTPTSIIAGTAEGSPAPLRVGPDGELWVGLASKIDYVNDSITVTQGTISVNTPGTITSGSIAVTTGTVAVTTPGTITSGSIAVTAGTVSVTTPGTITSGSISVIAGTIGTVGTVSGIGGTSLVRILDVTGADLDLFKQGDNFAVGADHGLSILGLGDGTPKTYSFIRVEGVDADGENSLTEGALSTEAYGMYYNGATWDRIRGDGTSGAYTQVIKGSIAVTAGTIGNALTVGTLSSGTINAGTINTGTIRIDARPARNILSYGTTVALAGTAYGTIIGSAAVGAGTSIWINEVSLINAGVGTSTFGIGFGTFMSGTSVLVRGKFVPGSGIQKSFPMAVNCGVTNSDLNVFTADAAGTVDVSVSYFISA
jgi:hypothetical protein